MAHGSTVVPLRAVYRVGTRGVGGAGVVCASAVLPPTPSTVVMIANAWLLLAVGLTQLPPSRFPCNLGTSHCNWKHHIFLRPARCRPGQTRLQGTVRMTSRPGLLMRTTLTNVAKPVRLTWLSLLVHGLQRPRPSTVAVLLHYNMHDSTTAVMVAVLLTVG